jgi:hypothetical protein
MTRGVNKKRLNNSVDVYSQPSDSEVKNALSRQMDGGATREALSKQLNGSATRTAASIPMNDDALKKAALAFLNGDALRDAVLSQLNGDVAKREAMKQFCGSALSHFEYTQINKPLSEYKHLHSFLAPNIAGIDYFSKYEERRKEEIRSLFSSNFQPLSPRLNSEFSESIYNAFDAVIAPIQEQPEFKARFLGMDLHKAIEDGDDDEIVRIMNAPEFGAEVLKAMHRAAKMSKDESLDFARDVEQVNITRTIIHKYVGVDAMAKARRKFEPDDIAKIQAEAKEKKRKNPALTANAINQQLAIAYKVSISTINRALKAVIKEK